MGGRRVYGPDTVRTLAVIETGQRAGLTLDEIRALLSASPDDQAAIERLREEAAGDHRPDRAQPDRPWLARERRALRMPQPRPVPAVRRSGCAAGPRWRPGSPLLALSPGHRRQESSVRPLDVFGCYRIHWVRGTH